MGISFLTSPELREWKYVKEINVTENSSWKICFLYLFALYAFLCIGRQREEHYIFLWKDDGGVRVVKRIGMEKAAVFM